MKRLSIFFLLAASAFGAVGDPILETSDPLVFESRSVLAGLGLGGGGTLASDPTLTFDATELANLTWHDGTNATLVFNYSLSGATDPQWTFGDNSVDLTVGVLKVGGSAVLTASSDQITACDAPTTLTISSGAITTTGGANTITCFDVDTEASASSDPLTTVNCTAGSIAILRAEDATRTVVVTDGAGMLVQADFSLDNTEDYIMIGCPAANTIQEMSRANNGA